MTSAREDSANACSPPVPEVLQVEVTTRCNLSCAFCQARPAEVRARGDLAYETYERVLSELHPGIGRVNLWGAGEPMLHPQVFRMVRSAATLGVGRIKVSTNGHFLSPDSIDEILDSGVTQIRIALDSRSPELYERQRRGGQFSHVVAGISALCSAKERRGSRLRVVVCAVISRSGGEENAAVAELARSLGADAFETSHDIWDEHGEHTTKRPHERCARPFKYFELLADGRVAPCCHVWATEWILGDTTRTDALEIWRGPAARRLRQAFAGGRFPYCARCNYWGPANLRTREREDKDFATHPDQLGQTLDGAEETK
jgi:MoaA/NifB/PqqE/SkfB family radical SAM enzyme